MKQPWEQDPDSWKPKSERQQAMVEAWAKAIASLQRATESIQQFSDAFAVWELTQPVALPVAPDEPQTNTDNVSHGHDDA